MEPSKFIWYMSIWPKNKNMWKKKKKKKKKRKYASYEVWFVYMKVLLT